MCKLRAMKLYMTPTSPYARIARVAVQETGLADRVEMVVAKTRTAGSPYYELNPSGRVPFLSLEDGRGFEGSTLICHYLDSLDGKPRFAREPQDWEGARLEALAYSLLDGLAVWLRELHRPSNEQSPGIITHEKSRAARLLGAWDQEIVTQRMQSDPLSIEKIVLGCALGLEARMPDLHWRTQHPALTAWFDIINRRPSFASTAPPPGS